MDVVSPEMIGAAASALEAAERCDRVPEAEPGSAMEGGAGDSAANSLLRHILTLTPFELERPEVCEGALLALFRLQPQSRLEILVDLLGRDPWRYGALIDAVDTTVQAGAIAPVAELSRVVLLTDILCPRRRRRVDRLLRHA